MGNQHPSALGSEQQRRGPRGNKLQWRLMPLVIIAAALVAVLALAVLGRFGPPPPASPLPVRTVLPLASEGATARLHTVAYLPLTGGTSRFDYQSEDPHTRLLFIAHLGARTVTVFDLAAGRIRANIAHISDVHGVLAIPELWRV